MDKIVLDTNSLIQCIPSRSPYHQIWSSFFDGRNKLCVSTEILVEYEEILERLTDLETANMVIELIINNPSTLFVTPYYKFQLIHADQDDNKFIDCAVCAGAKFIITEDRHFEVVKQCDFPRIEIVGLDDYMKFMEANRKHSS